MQVTETLSEGLRRGFTVVVPAADIEGRRAAKLGELGRTLRLPGFRPGKVPLPIIRQRYGAAVTAEVLEESVSAATEQMLSDRGLRAAAAPKVDLVRADAAEDLEFKVEVELLPEIIIPDLAAISLTRLRAEPAADAVDQALTEIAARQRTLEPVEPPRPAETGDVVRVDFIGRIDGEAFPGGTGTDMDVEIGASGFIPGFAEQMVGLSVGETRMIDVTFPAEYGAAELAGKPAQFEITGKAVLRPVVPAVDEDLAQKLGFEEGIDKLRELIATRIQREYDQLSRMKLKRILLDALAERIDFASPESMVEPEFAQIWERLEADRKEGKLDSEDASKDEATLRAEYRTIAERRVRLGLLLAEIGRINGIQVSQDELLRAMRAEAARYQGQERQVMEFFQKNPRAAESLRGPIFEEKVVDFILELAQITDQTVTPEELTTAVEGDAEAGAEAG